MKEIDHLRIKWHKKFCNLEPAKGTIQSIQKFRWGSFLRDHKKRIQAGPSRKHLLFYILVSCRLSIKYFVDAVSHSAVSHSGIRKHVENPTTPGVQRSVLQRRPSPSTSVGRWTEPHRLDVQRSVDSDEFWSPCLETVYLVVSELWCATVPSPIWDAHTVVNG
jgi:hypothetical protein